LPSVIEDLGFWQVGAKVSRPAFTVLAGPTLD